jgi:hypothetical protein
VGRFRSRPQFSVFGQPVVIGSDAKHRGFRFGVRKLFRNTACFFSAAAPMLRIIDNEGNDLHPSNCWNHTLSDDVSVLLC